MPSLQSRIIASILKLTSTKQVVDKIHELKNRNGNIERIKPTSGQMRRFNITSEEFHGNTVWTIAPKHGTKDDIIYFFHGGAYVYSFLPIHWQFICNIVTETGCTVVAPDYPLAPEKTVEETFAMVSPLYEKLVAEHGAGRITLMGDSAGGGLALALAQYLQAEGKIKPKRIVLLSPWLDVSMTHPDLPSLEAHDPILSVRGLRDAGRMYAGSHETTSPLVSPLYGTCTNLSQISLFIGTKDILLADCRRLRDNLKVENIKIDYREYEGMLHDWMLMPIPEAKQVTREIVQIMNK